MTRYLLPLLFVLQLLAGISGPSPGSAAAAWDTAPPRSDPSGTKGDGPPLVDPAGTKGDGPP